MTFAFDPLGLTLPPGHHIGGQYVSAAEDIAVSAPSNGASLGAIPRADAAMVDRAVEAARTALRTSGWGIAAPRDRLRALHRWADLIEQEAETLARHALMLGRGVRLMEASALTLHEPPRDTDWEILGADAPGENWEDHRDPRRAFALFERKLRWARVAGARLQYKLWLAAA